MNEQSGTGGSQRSKKHHGETRKSCHAAVEHECMVFRCLGGAHRNVESKQSLLVASKIV